MNELFQAKQAHFEKLSQEEIAAAVENEVCPLCGCRLSYIPGSKIGGRFLGESYAIFFECVDCGTEIEKNVHHGLVLFKGYF